VDIDELFNHYGTDKECYAAMYHALFKHIRHGKLRLLEVGIGTMIPEAPSSMVGSAREGYRPGGSLRAWRDYFPNSDIHGIDVQPDTQFKDERGIDTHLCDSTDGEAVSRLMHGLGGVSFDIIIDDGAHLDMQQLATLTNLFPYVADGGYYIIEDIGPGGELLTTLFQKLRAVCGDSLVFITEEKNYLVISRRLVARPNGHLTLRSS
jgi:hypothetical protein